MKLKMKKISVAVAASLGASLVGMSASQSDELLFPYLVTSQTVTSVVSVVNRSPLNPQGTSTNRLHYVYLFNNGGGPCTEFNFRRPTSHNDIQTFDIGDRFAADNLHVLFNDPSFNNNYLAANLDFAPFDNAPLPIRSFLVVDNNGTTGEGASEGSLYGEVVVLDFAAGAAWGYRAYNALTDEALAQGQATGFFDTGNFANEFESAGEVLAGDNDSSARATPRCSPHRTCPRWNAS